MLINIKDLWKTYGSGESQVNALRGINLTISRGEFVALVGPSGCGKSTLLNMLGAMDTPSKGKVELDGQELGQLNEDKLTNIRLKSIGFIFQTFNLLPLMSALDNVMLPMKLNGKGKRVSRKNALELLEQVGLKERIMHFPAKMSGGQRQRVAIARAMANHPTIILADEPTGNLDSENGEIIMNILKDLNKKGHTIIMVTHNSDLAEQAGKIIQMKDGQIICVRLQKTKHAFLQ